MDSGWEDLAKGWQRLRWARARWLEKNGAVNNSARYAAESLGMSASTYSQYEREDDKDRHADLSTERAIEFARKFKVNWVWLLTGVGTPFEVAKSEPMLILENRLRKLSDEELVRAATLIEMAFPKVADGTGG